MAAGATAVAIAADDLVVWAAAGPVALIGAGGAIWQVIYMIRHRGELR